MQVVLLVGHAPLGTVSSRPGYGGCTEIGRVIVAHLGKHTTECSVCGTICWLHSGTDDRHHSEDEDITGLEFTFTTP